MHPRPRGLTMTDQHATPSRDPANDDSLLGMARQVLDKFLSQIDDMLPARVVSYDRAANRATVVPLVKLLTTDGRQVGRAQVASVPVMLFGGDGVALSFNLKAGDLGWIKANDRDISLILQAYRDNAPNTLRKHTFQDAVFIPDVMHGVTTAGEDAENAVLQTLDGSVRVAIWPDRVKITKDAMYAEVGPENVSLINGASSAVLTPTGINLSTGGAAASMGAGGTTFSGHVSFPDGVSISGIEFGTHKHTGVTPGGGTSGGPTS
jgi:hypothetical protein